MRHDKLRIFFVGAQEMATFLLFCNSADSRVQRCEYRMCRAVKKFRCGRFFSIKKFRCGNTNLHNCHNFQLSVSYDEHQFENTFHNWITILSSTLVNFSSPVFGCMRMALVCWILSGSPSFKGSLANIHLYVCISLNVFIPLLSKCEVNPHLTYMRS